MYVILNNSVIEKCINFENLTLQYFKNLRE